MNKIKRVPVILFLLTIFFITTATCSAEENEVSILEKSFEKKSEYDFDVVLRADETKLLLKQILNVKVLFFNKGNTEINPIININLENGDNINYKLIERLPDSIGTIKPNTSVEVPIEISTIGLPQGKYIAHFNFFQKDEHILDKDLVISLISPNDSKSIFTTINKIRNEMPLSSLAFLVAFLVGLTTLTFYIFNRINIRSADPSYQEFLKFDD